MRRVVVVQFRIAGIPVKSAVLPANLQKKKRSAPKGSFVSPMITTMHTLTSMA